MKGGYTDKQVIGALLTGGCRLFGARVELAWPDGLPGGFTEIDLRRIGEQWTAGMPGFPQWVLADAPMCGAMIRCGKVLVNGKCEWHGTAVRLSLACAAVFSGVPVVIAEAAGPHCQCGRCR